MFVVNLHFDVAVSQLQLSLAAVQRSTVASGSQSALQVSGAGSQVALVGFDVSLQVFVDA